MNYIGSKHSLLPFIEQVYSKVCEGSGATFCDIFAGTGAVGRHFKRLGLRVIANDFQHYAYALNKAYIEINHPPKFTRLHREFAAAFAALEEADPVMRTLAFAGGLRGRRGFITNHYSPVGDRLYYTENPTIVIQASR